MKEAILAQFAETNAAVQAEFSNLLRISIVFMVFPIEFIILILIHGAATPGILYYL
jgi:hypothetical protein